MTPVRCDLPDEDLVTYASGELNGARAEYVELHLSNCPACQRRLAEFEAIDQLIASAGPGEDDPLHRAEIKVRIAELSARPARRTTGDVWWKPAMVLVAVALISLAFLPLNSSLADFRIGRVFQFFDVPSSTPSEPDDAGSAASKRGQIPATMVPVAFEIVAPETLPYGFERIDQHRTSADRIETIYRNGAGLRFTLTQMPVSMANFGVSTSGSEVIPIAGVDVIVQSSPWSSAAYGAHWAFNDYVFSTTIEGDGFTSEMLKSVVAEIIEATD